MMNQITYSIHGLANSHSAVLRSMVLLTEKSVACAWKSSLEANSDVLFLGTDTDPDAFYPRPGQILISVGECNNKQSLHLDLPLVFPRVAKLLSSVTQAALHEQIQRPNKEAGLMPSIWNLGFLPPSASHSLESSSGQRYKLKTWPPAGIIGSNRSYMRAAAVLTGKSLTSSELAAKTSLPLGDCREFIGKLSDSQCLNITPPGSSPCAPGFAPTAGLAPAAAAPSPLPPNTPSPAVQNGHSSSPTLGSGLLGRIRSRLGFLGKATT